MDKVGEELRLRRESMGLSLREVEDATKIRMKYLIALEADDFQVLPGKAYVFGFLRTYARYLEVNDEELVQRAKETYNFTSDDDDEQPLVKEGTPQKKPSIFFLSLIIAVLVLGGLGYSYFKNRGPAPNQQSAPHPQEQISQDQEEPPSASLETIEPENAPPKPGIEEPEITGVSVTIIVKNTSCWLDVKIDGKSDFSGTLESGENRTFVGQEIITIKYGNARVVEVIHNGKSTFPVDSSGQVVTKDYKADDNPL